MTAPDTMVDVYRRLALALEPDLVEGNVLAGGQGPAVIGVRVSNDRGLEVRSLTALGAWTLALEACQRRAAWRTMKARRKLEKPEPYRLAGPVFPDDYDQPDGAA